MSADIDINNKIDSFTSVALIDPFDKDGIKKSKQKIMEYKFEKDVYDKTLVKEMLDAV